MSFPRDRQELEALYSRAESVASMVQLPFRHELWKGYAGNWLGAGIGSSIDFQDHRQYLPGDDPRYINWQAYARTGNYSMKLYREEVSPIIDLALDISGSMAVTPGKAARAIELFYFCVTCALQTTASLRCYRIDGDEVAAAQLDAVRGHTWLPEEGAANGSATTSATGPADPPAFRRVPWRAQAMRIFITDLLYPGSPDGLLPPGQSRGLIFCPWAQEEADPDWEGNVELRDCESGHRRVKHFSNTALKRYRESYREHFAMWEDHCHGYGIKFARISSRGDLAGELTREALSVGAVEILK